MSSPIVTPNQTSIEVKLGDGTIVKGKDLDEAFANLSKMKVDTAAALREREDSLKHEKEERERISQELETVKTELAKSKEPVKAAPKPDDGKGFNRETYFQILGEDPMKAQDYVDSFRFGIDSPDKVRDTFNTLRERVDTIGHQVDNFTQQSVTATFLAQHPDYPQGDVEAAKKLTAKVDELMKQGMPYNPTVVEFAYYQLINSDQIKPLEATTDDKPTVTEPPNPSLSGSSVISEEAVAAEKMSDKDLLSLLQSKGMFK